MQVGVQIDFHKLRVSGRPPPIKTIELMPLRPPLNGHTHPHSHWHTVLLHRLSFLRLPFSFAGVLPSDVRHTTSQQYTPQKNHLHLCLPCFSSVVLGTLSFADRAIQVANVNIIYIHAARTAVYPKPYSGYLAKLPLASGNHGVSIMSRRPSAGTNLPLTGRGTCTALKHQARVVLQSSPCTEPWSTT